jgi:AsmA protein
VTAATGLKRLAIAVATIVAAAFGTLVALSFLMPAGAVRDAVRAEIRGVTGLDPNLGDDVSLSLFPSGTARFRDVRLGDDRAGEPTVAAEELTARLRYFPLLAGRVEVADVVLVHPIIRVKVLENGETNWSGLIGALAQALKPDPNRRASFSEIGIQGGTVIVQGSGKAPAERFENVDFQIAWPSISRSFGANGRFSWHDEPVEASFTLSDFLAALAGDRSGVKLRLSSVPLTLGFDGTTSNQPTLKVNGMLSVESPALRKALEWTGGGKVPLGGFGRFALRAESDIGGGMVALSNVNVELDGNSAEGALTVATDGHRAIQGTLAAEAIDLTPYVAGIRLLAKNQRAWDQMPIALDGFNDLNLDLRLSAASIKVSNAQLGRTAVAAGMRDGKLDLTIGESQAFGGIAKGTLGLAAQQGTVGVSAHVQFVDVDLENCLGQVFGLRKLQGHGNLALNLDGSGTSVLAVTRALNGTASLDANGGSLSGIDLEQLLRRLERRPLSGSGDFRSGRTPFDHLAANVKVEQGLVSIDDMHVDGPAVKVAVAGQASVPARDLDLKGVASLIATNTADGFDLPFVVQGPWDDPIMLPDPQSLIRRSGAAAPLLDSAKGYNASDAVRSVIDQLLAQPSGQKPGVSAVSAPDTATSAGPGAGSSPAKAPQ